MPFFSLTTLKTIGLLLKQTFTGFLADRALKLSASLSYYTVFSMAPLLLLLISLAGFFFGRDAIQGHVFHEINGLIGNDAAAQIQDVIKHMELSGKTNLALVIGVVTLIIGATSVFGEIQDSINIIWKVKAKPKRGWVKLLTDRLRSSSLIIGLGFLLIVSLVVNGALVGLNDWLKGYFPQITLLIFNVINIVISFGVITLLFAVIFKVLPDAKISWKHVRMGAFFTACFIHAGTLSHRGLYPDDQYGIGLWSGRIDHNHSRLGVLHGGHPLFRCRIYPRLYRIYRCPH